MPLDRPRPEEDLHRFARRHGVDAAHVRKHPDNRDVFEVRSTQVLHEEDEIFVPEEPAEPRRVESGKTHVLVYAPPDRVLELRLLDDDWRPISADYTLTEIEYDDSAEGNGPKEVYGYAHEGHLYQRLPGAALRAKLVIDAQDEPIPLELGRLDPVTKRTGLLERLAQLGLYLGPRDGETYDAGMHQALRIFQSECGVPATGQADEATRAALLRRCGA